VHFEQPIGFRRIYRLWLVATSRANASQVVQRNDLDIYVFLYLLMFMALRARLLRSAWVIPLCVLLSFPSASLAYLAYFGLFEPPRLLNALTQVGFFQFTFMLLILSPAISLVWLFGGLAG
jgi:hypothetical protein